MKPGLIIVSNRLPIGVKKIDSKLEFFPTIGGLATGLASYTSGKKNKWIGWPGIASDELSDKDRHQIAEELRAHNCYPVFLSKKLLNDYYNGYSNSILWPLFHNVKLSSTALAEEEQYWKAYRRANAAFAEAVLALSTSGTDIWVHDYQLLLLPATLRNERPDDKIGFFLHTPFPTAKEFEKLIEGEALIAGALGSDLVGLHTDSYVQNFLDAVRHYDSGITEHKKVILRDRVVRVIDFPIGIDYQKYVKANKSQAIKKELNKLKIKYSRQKVILSVDRLDPAKGLVERAVAFQTFLRENPQFHGRIIMVMLVVPSRTEIAEYKKLKIKLEKLVHDINSEFGSSRWQPLDYRYESLAFEKLTALYQRADVAFIVPLRDGMNLVAKEYLASRPHKDGVLILSQTAGAAEELKEALMVDPARPATLVLSLKHALTMPQRELNRRVTTMQNHIAKSTVDKWAGNFMHSLRLNNTLKPRYLASLTPKRRQEIIQSFLQATHRLLLLDYDGVLVPFSGDPKKSKPSPKLTKTLTQLANNAETEIVIISGRKKADLFNWLHDIPVHLVAEHGTYSKKKGAHAWQAVHSSATKNWQDTLLPILEKYTAKTPGAFVETKEAALVWHYRKASPYYAQKNLVTLKRVLKPLVKKLGLEARQGNMILEVKPSDINKGNAALPWLAANPEFILVIGDDYTDEDMFNAMPGHAFTVKVGRGRTNAQLRANNIDQILELLEKLAKA